MHTLVRHEYDTLYREYAAVNPRATDTDLVKDFDMLSLDKIIDGYSLPLSSEWYGV
jgi:hypothetical protein